MDVYRLASLLGSLGVKTSVVGQKVRCNCLLSSWTHSGGRDDSPSMVVFAEGKHGDPIYSCLACHERGSLRDLLCFIWSKTGRNMMDHIEAIDGSEKPIPQDVKNVSVHHTRLRHKEKLKGGFEESKRKRIKDDGSPWFDRLAIEEAHNVQEIPWDVYAPYIESIPIPAYAYERGLCKETCEEWEIGDDRHHRRMLFPMRDRDGRLVAISGRLYEEKACLVCGGNIVVVSVQEKKKPIKLCSICGRKLPPKYLHNDGFKRNLHLYGENRKDEGHCYVVEGHLDVLILWQMGYRPVVATLGSYPGEAQIEKLVAYYPALIVVPDGDDAGKSMANLVKKMIAGRIPVSIANSLDGKDPGDFTPSIAMEILGPPPYTAIDKDQTIS